MKLKYWDSKVPKKEGWYWIRYKGKQGIVVCPALVLYSKIDEECYFVRTARNDSFSSHTKKQFGKTHFGDEIEIPSASLKF